MKLFKKKVEDPLKKELKPYKKKEQKRLRKLYEKFEQGKVLKVDGLTDNKILMKHGNTKANQ